MDKPNVVFVGSQRYNIPFKEDKWKVKFDNFSKDFGGSVIAYSFDVYAEGKYKDFNFYLYKRKNMFDLVLYGIKTFAKIVELNRKNKIDVIISQDPTLCGMWATIAGKITGTKTIIEVHGDWVNSVLLYKKRRFGALIGLILKVLGKFSIRNAGCVRVVSKAMEEKVKDAGFSGEICTFPAFIDLNLFLKKGDKEFKKDIVFVGSLYKLKGVDYLIDAFSGLADTDARLVIIGDGPERKNLEKMVEGSENVVFLGHLDNSEVKKRLDKALVLVLPSLSEGLGLVLLEAMACGKPVIGSDVGGIPELIEDGKNGYIVKAKDSDALRDRLRMFTEDMGLARRMGYAGHKFVLENFSKDKYFNDYAEMIRGVAT